MVLQGFGVLLQVEIGIAQLAVDGTESLQVLCPHLHGCFEEGCPSFEVPCLTQALSFQGQLQARCFHSAKSKIPTFRDFRPGVPMSPCGIKKPTQLTASRKTPARETEAPRATNCTCEQPQAALEFMVGSRTRSSCHPAPTLRAGILSIAWHLLFFQGVPKPHTQAACVYAASSGEQRGQPKPSISSLDTRATPGCTELPG